mmetsp:Transcript_5805/g.16300  ORF Transcript_5805/g.16300 Transcript_5805/m.16300 type:complete len:310 (-) Transcript_5805:393-1322(-)
MAPSGGKARPDEGGSGKASSQARQIVRCKTSAPSSDFRDARTAAFSARKTSSSFDVLSVSAANAKRATRAIPETAARPSPVESIGAGWSERAVSTIATCSPPCKAATLGPDAANSSACATLRHFRSEARHALGALGPSAPAAPSAAVASSAPATLPNHGVAEALTSAAAQVNNKAHVASPKEPPGALDHTSNRSTNASPRTSSERHAAHNATCAAASTSGPMTGRKASSRPSDSRASRGDLSPASASVSASRTTSWSFEAASRAACASVSDASSAMRTSRMRADRALASAGLLLGRPRGGFVHEPRSSS